MRVRRFESGRDSDAVLSFLQRLEAASGVAPLGESKLVDLGGPLTGHGFVGEDGEIVAYLHMLWHEPSRVWEMELAAAAGLGASRFESILGEAARLASGRMLWWTFGRTGGAEFARRRFAVARRLHLLEGPLPLSERFEVPDAVRIAAFRPGVDEDAWLVANNAAFAGHPENGGWTRREILEREHRDWFEAEGFRLWWVKDRVAGFCWTKRHGPRLGEIHVIGVHPEFQRRGLGRAIVLEGLAYLAGAGCDRAMLYVDAANRTALGLYQSLGFEVERADACFEIPKGWPHEVQ